MDEDLRECSKCGERKPIRVFHNRTCYPCGRDIWRQNKGLPPLDPRNKDNHLIGYPIRVRGRGFQVDPQDTVTREEILALAQKKKIRTNRAQTKRLKLPRD